MLMIAKSPIRAFWVWPRMPNSRCWDDGMLTLACGVANTVADLLVTVIPIPLIARLELPRRRRIGAFIFVGTGFLICAAGVIRAFYTWRSLISSYDQTWESYGMFMSAAIEIDLGVVGYFFTSVISIGIEAHTNVVSLDLRLCSCSSYPFGTIYQFHHIHHF